MRINIRDARIEEARFVGRCLLAAMEIMGLDETESSHQELADSVAKGCAREDELYSYLRARIAECDEKPAGCIISYDGKDYEALREVTFNRLLRENGLDLTNNPQETLPGEYYLDCMAILPQYRGLGIGHLLMQDRIDHARQLGIKKATLLVDKEHIRLKQYYQKLGFETKKEMIAYETLYEKMSKQL